MSILDNILMKTMEFRYGKTKEELIGESYIVELSNDLYKECMNKISDYNENCPFKVDSNSIIPGCEKGNVEIEFVINERCINPLISKKNNMLLLIVTICAL